MGSFSCFDLPEVLHRCVNIEGFSIVEYFMEDASSEKLDKFLLILEKIKPPDTSVFLFAIYDSIVHYPRYFYIGMHRLIHDLVLSKIINTLENSGEGSVNTYFNNIPEFELPKVQ